MVINHLKKSVQGLLFTLVTILAPAQLQAESSFYHVHSDHRGAPLVVTDESQTVVWKANYKPFGEVELEVNTVEMPLRLPGQYSDEETGYYYNYHRDYDPKLGRYIQSDPIGLNGGLNTYGYVDGNPLSLIDPLGLASISRPGATGSGGYKGGGGSSCGPGLGGRGRGFGAGGGSGSGGVGSFTTPGATQGPIAIGRLKDLKNLKPGERSLLDRLPDKGNPKANWNQNSGVLRQEMRKGKPIRDASPGNTSGQILNAERNQLRNGGWSYDPKTNYWNPPK